MAPKRKYSSRTVIPARSQVARADGLLSWCVYFLSVSSAVKKKKKSDQVYITGRISNSLYVFCLPGVHHPKGQRTGLRSVFTQRTIPVHQRAAFG